MLFRRCLQTSVEQAWRTLAGKDHAEFVTAAMRNLSINKTPSRVQEATASILSSGASAIVTASTGSGKTLAYLIPTLSKHCSAEPHTRTHSHQFSPKVLIITPSQPLVLQLLRVVSAFPQVSATTFPFPEGVPRRSIGSPMLAVSTPTSLVAGVSPMSKSQIKIRKGLQALLENTETVIIDEADQIMGDKSSLQLISDMVSVAKRICKRRAEAAAAVEASQALGGEQKQAVAVNTDIQFVFVAATLEPVPVETNLKKSHLPRAKIMKLVPNVISCDENAVNTPPPNLKHSFIKVFNENEVIAADEPQTDGKGTAAAPDMSEGDQNLARLNAEFEAKVRLLMKSVELQRTSEKMSSARDKPEQWIVFCTATKTVQYLAEVFQKWAATEAGVDGDAIQILALYRQMPEQARWAILHQFSQGTVPQLSEASTDVPTHQILFTTDFAARGMDFANVSKVILFDFSATVDQYLHRTGRTAREGGHGHGEAISFIGKDDTKMMERIEALVRRERTV
ncbi:putative ATP-dependent RNA helicase ddx28 [Chytriomyces hyalinus]|nr:putative ATP-dependent RNA helicase ddx28 [Chytriomyces hyalinus]